MVAVISELGPSYGSYALQSDLPGGARAGRDYARRSARTSLQAGGLEMTLACCVRGRRLRGTTPWRPVGAASV